MLLRFAAAVLLLFLGGLPLAELAAGSSLSDTKSRLDAIQKRIESAGRELKEKAAAQAELEADVGLIEREVLSLEKREKQLEKQLKGGETAIDEAETESRWAQQALKKVQARFEQRLAALYKAGPAGPVQLLFSGLPPSELEEQYLYMQKVLAADDALVTDYRARSRRLGKALERRKRLQQEREALLEEIRQGRSARSRALALKERLLGKVRVERKALDARIEELRRDAAALMGLVKKLESVKTPQYTAPGAGFSAQKGRLPWPNQAPVRIHFGTNHNPRLGVSIESNGLEFSQGTGAVKAVWGGRIIFADHFKGYGNLLIVDHGESYYSLYARLSSLGKRLGEQVEKDEVLGRIDPAAPEGFYFELRFHGTPLNPSEWLTRR